jgi:hypothetical protein
VTVFDHLSSGSDTCLRDLLGNDRLALCHRDLQDKDTVATVAGHDHVYGPAQRVVRAVRYGACFRNDAFRAGDKVIVLGRLPV